LHLALMVARIRATTRAAGDLIRSISAATAGPAPTVTLPVGEITAEAQRFDVCQRLPPESPRRG
jgi:hypothetical protein